MSKEKQEKPPYFKLYVQDFLLGVQYMSAEEVGAYILMLCAQWDKGYLEKDEKILRKISKISEKKRKNVEKKFKINELGLQNERLEIERSKYINFYNNQHSNGSKGGRPKKTETQRLLENNPTVPKIETQNNPIHSHSHSQIDTIVSPATKNPIDATIEKVAEYFGQNYIFDKKEVDLFFAHYDSVGWVVNGQKVTGVKSLVNKWLINSRDKAISTQTETNSAADKFRKHVK